jgi:glycosyltransferase involved in cell wall biosynthesis
MAPAVSFVVPCYNYGRFLGDCLRSIFTQQNAPELEVLVVDDASTDNTAEVLRAFADPRLRVITHAKNRGHIASINEAFGEARGELIARIDADDRYRPHFLSLALAKLRACPSVGLVYGDAAFIDTDGAFLAERSHALHVGDFRGNELEPLLLQNYICCPTVIARRRAWDEVLPIPPEVVFEDDWYCSLRIARKWEFYYIDQVLADYRIHPGNHHSKVISDGREEASVFWLLDRMFDDGAALPPDFRRRVYAAHYLTVADKYFGEGMDADARRCYLESLRRRPGGALDPGLVRRLFGTLIGRSAYESLKSTLKSISQ